MTYTYSSSSYKHMFERILIPTDGSEIANEAAEIGLDLAVEHGATVHALYVVEPPYADEVGIQQAIEEIRAAGEQAVAKVAERAEAKGLTVTTGVESGTPYHEILEYIETNDIDLVVMGTHSRTGLNRYLLGSVTQRIVRLSEVPVLTISAGSSGSDWTYRTYSLIPDLPRYIAAYTERSIGYVCHSTPNQLEEREYRITRRKPTVQLFEEGK